MVLTLIVDAVMYLLLRVVVEMVLVEMVFVEMAVATTLPPTRDT